MNDLKPNKRHNVYVETISKSQNTQNPHLQYWEKLQKSWYLAYWAWFYHNVSPSKLSWKCHIAYTCEVTLDMIEFRHVVCITWHPYQGPLLMLFEFHPTWVGNCIHYDVCNKNLSIHKLLHCLRNFIPHCTWHVGYNPQLGMMGYTPRPHPTGSLKNWLDAGAFHKSWHDQRDFDNNWCIIKNKITHILKRCHLYLEMSLWVTLLPLRVKKHMSLLQTYPFVTAILAISRCMAMICLLIMIILYINRTEK